MATISTMLKFTDGFSNPLDKLINKTKQATNAAKGIKSVNEFYSSANSHE